MTTRHLFALLLGLFVASDVSAAELRIQLRDAATLAPTAARVGVSGPSGEFFTAPDSTLRSHRSQGIAPFVHVDGELVLGGLDAGLYTVWAQRGPTGLRSEDSVLLDGESATLELWLDRWVDPRAAGWVSADAHVHPKHDPASGYPEATPEQMHRIAAAEDLDLLFALAGSEGTPLSGPAWVDARAAVHYGREYRNGWWGHVVLLGLVTDPGPGCCRLDEIGAQPLDLVVPASAPQLTILAHPTTTDRPNIDSTWPGGGYARELFALALGGVAQAVAVGSASNGPDSEWQITRYLESLRTGAHWAAVGESDATLERYNFRVPGALRSYARLDPPTAPDQPEFVQRWTDAIRAARCYATDGPLLLQVNLEGAGLGETALLASGRLELDLATPAPLRWLRIHGQDGDHVDWSWPDGAGPTTWTGEILLSFDHDDFVVLDVGCGDAAATQRLISSPIWIDRGITAPEPVEAARAAVDELRLFWRYALIVRGFASAEDEAAARNVFVQAWNAYEAMADDPPGPFDLLFPLDGRVLPSTDVNFRWRRPASYDGEATQFEVQLDDDPGFGAAQSYAAGADSQLNIEGLAAGTSWHWRVLAIEDGDVPRPNEAPDGRFEISANPVAAPAALSDVLRIEGSSNDGTGLRVRFALAAPRHLRAHWFDVRGRALHVAPWNAWPQGSHELRWNGLDGRGERIANGRYWLLLETDRGESSRAAVIWRAP